ncbi:hypothetical protein B0T10DRAFT_549769 [Thelonectria olida]|uniref:Uncharacterized protein n=1 Tax=Thelonectria olida TaxID=1576542 RepID=A0A9P8W1Q0_9HYPO|nr:hypothetical protein B0T10DRAFT_549769 [Thelonectria olida]
MFSHTPMGLNGLRSSNIAQSLSSGFQARVSNAVAHVEPYKTSIEVLLMLSLYLTYSDANIRYIKSPRRMRAVNFPYLMLNYHIVVGLLLAGRYYLRRLLEPSVLVIPDQLDFLLGFSHALSALSLARTKHSRRPFAKASFQTVALLELVAAMWAYLAESPQWHFTTVKIIDWFVTFRTTARLIHIYDAFGFPEGSADGLTHLISAPFTLWLSGYPLGIPLYYAVLGSLMSAEKLVSQHVPDNPRIGNTNAPLSWHGKSDKVDQATYYCRSVREEDYTTAITTKNRLIFSQVEILRKNNFPE